MYMHYLDVLYSREIVKMMFVLYSESISTSGKRKHILDHDGNRNYDWKLKVVGSTPFMVRYFSACPV